MRWISALVVAGSLLALAIPNESRAQAFLKIRDTVEGIRFYIDKDDRITWQLQGETGASTGKVRKIRHAYMIVNKHHELDTVYYDKMDYVLIRPAGAFMKLYLITTGVSAGLLILMLRTEVDFTSLKGMGGVLLTAPITLGLVPALATKFLLNSVYPKQKLDRSGRFRWEYFR
jgi:hypothetical protein